MQRLFTLKGSELLSKTDKQCPFCLAKEVLISKYMDMHKFAVYCNHCGFHMEYYNSDTLLELWDVISNYRKLPSEECLDD